LILPFAMLLLVMATSDAQRSFPAPCRYAAPVVDVRDGELLFS